MQKSSSSSMDLRVSFGRRAGAAVGWTIGVGLAALLIVLIWTATVRSIEMERAAVERHATAETRAHAEILAGALGQEFRGADAVLRRLAANWAADPGRFDLASWRRNAVLLPQNSQLFLVDSAGVTLQSSVPGDIGQDFRDRDYFRHFRNAFAENQSPSRLAPALADAPLFIGQAQRDTHPQPGYPNGWHLNVARPLIGANGRFAGVADLSLPTHALLGTTSLGELGPKGVVALIGTDDGRVRSSIGGSSAAPPGTQVGARLRAVLRSGPGGKQAGGGIGRLVASGPLLRFAYQQVPGQNLAVVVGMDRAWMLRDSQRWAAVTRWFGLAITALVLLAAAVGFGEFRAMQRRAQRLGRERAMLAAANASLAAAKGRADAKTAQLEGLLGGMADGVLLLDADLRVQAWNHQLAAIAGVPPEVLRVNEPIETLVRAQAERGEFGAVDPATEAASRVALLRSGRAFGRIERTRPNGVTIELRRERLPSGGSVTLFTDITERKRAEDALHKARAAAEAAAAGKSRFIAMVSHELRTPLHALLNGLALLEQTLREQPAEDVRAAMRQSGDALLRLLEDILDVSRMEAGRLSVETVAFDPRGPLERAAAMLRPIAAARDVRLRLEVASDVPAQMSGDPARMQQVVANLLSNAAKFAPPGDVLVHAALSAGPAGKMLRIVVRDQGPDLAPAQRALLFRPFSRLPHATEGAAGDAPAGIGLGLSISRDLVTLMGGEIGCAAAPEGGNLFWFTLPLRPTLPPARETSAARLRAAARPRPLPRQRVLLAEDVPGSRLVTAAILRRDGHAVTAVADGAAAVVAAGSAPFDVVLRDLDLPGLDGMEATRRIRALPGSAGAVPVIGLTGEAEPARWAACHEAGMDEVIVKPAGRAELLAAIARHVTVPHAARTLRDAAGDPTGDPTGDPAGPGTAGAPAARTGTGTALPPGPAAGGAEDATLSPRRLAELRDTLAPATLAKIAEECLSELAEMTARLRQAQTAQDHTAAGSLAHAMAGLAGGYGLAAMERRMRAMLGAFRGGNPAEAATALEGIEAELARSAAGLRAALQIETV